MVEILLEAVWMVVFGVARGACIRIVAVEVIALPLIGFEITPVVGTAPNIRL